MPVQSDQAVQAFDLRIVTGILRLRGKRFDLRAQRRNLVVVVLLCMVRELCGALPSYFELIVHNNGHCWEAAVLFTELFLL